MPKLREPPAPSLNTSWARRRRLLTRACLQSVPLKLSRGPPPLPVRIRPVFIALSALTLVVLSLLGFHPNLSARLLLNDKILHFLCFGIATGLFLWIWDIEETARRIWIWRHFAAILTGFVCFLGGAIGSEFVQAMLPYKTFQVGDIIANLLGAGCGLYISALLERRHRRNRELRELYRPVGVEADDELDDARGPQAASGQQMFGHSTVWSDTESIFDVGELEDEDEPDLERARTPRPQ